MASDSKKSKAFPTTGQGCEMWRIPHFLDIRPTDVGEVVRLTRRPPLLPRKIPVTYFCYRLS
jgi:hypothetical protein